MTTKSRNTTICIVVLALSSLLSAQSNKRGSEAEVRKIVDQFEAGLKQRDLSQIEPLMASDLVALENGHRNDGWVDFRDHHLIPEMKDPAPESQTELLRVRASQDMAWAYTRTAMQMAGKDGEKVSYELWSTYILEKRGKEWKIVLLDWSMRRLRPPAK